VNLITEVHESSINNKSITDSSVYHSLNKPKEEKKE